MDYFDIIKETFYHYDSGGKSGNITNYQNYTKFVASANATKIYEIDSWLIGVEGIGPISINVDAELHIEIGKKVVSKLFGYPIKFENSESQKIALKRINDLITA